MSYLILLALLMSLFGILGYLFGLKASVLTAGVIWLLLMLIARAGGTIAQLINGLYYGIQFVMAGGLQAMSSSGDRAAAMARVTQQISPVKTLMSGNTAGSEFVVILGILLILTVMLSLTEPIRGPQSKLGLVIGLISGYLVGGYILNVLVPGLNFPLPYGLTPRLAAAQGVAPVPSVPATNQSLGAQLLQLLQSINETTLQLLIMFVIATFIISAIRLSMRGSKAR